jgi:hypothetical protein
MPETEEVREMRTAETVLNIIRDRGQRGLPVERLYRQLYNRDLYLRAYGKIYRNAGAMTPVERELGKAPLVAHFGGIPLRHNKWAAINDTPTKPIWSGRSEVVDRLLAQQCELCGATGNVEVHHIRKLADLKCYGQTHPPQWVQTMAARRRKTLVVCQDCHNAIQYGRYDGAKFSK